MFEFLNTWLTSGGFWVAVPLIIAGCAALIKGADFLVEGASGLAKKYGVSDIVIGLTVVAFGTSMPEFVVNMVAVGQGSTEIAITNVLGSNIIKIQRPAHEMIHRALRTVCIIDQQREAVAFKSFCRRFERLRSLHSTYALCRRIAIYRTAKKIMTARIADFFPDRRNLLSNINKTLRQHKNLHRLIFSGLYRNSPAHAIHASYPLTICLEITANVNFWIDNFKEGIVKDNTSKNYKNRYNFNIKKEIGNMKLCEVKQIHCQKLLNDMPNSR